VEMANLAKCPYCGGGWAGKGVSPDHVASCQRKHANGEIVSPGAGAVSSLSTSTLEGVAGQSDQLDSMYEKLQGFGVESEYDMEGNLVSSQPYFGPEDFNSVSAPFSERQVAASSSTDPSTLTELSRDPDWEVREAVINNASSPESAVRRISRDPDWTLRKRAAQHGNIRVADLEDLAMDLHPDVAAAAASHPKAKEMSDDTWHKLRDRKDIYDVDSLVESGRPYWFS